MCTCVGGTLSQRRHTASVGAPLHGGVVGLHSEVGGMCNLR